MAVPSDELMDLIFTGLDYGIDSVRDGGPLVPFVLVEHEGQRALRRIVVGDPFDSRPASSRQRCQPARPRRSPGTGWSSSTTHTCG